MSAEPTRQARIVIAKPGLDGHDRGAKIVARLLRDAGYEVIYTGLHQTPEQVVAVVVQEDADAVGLSILSGAHMTLFARVISLLHDAGSDDVVVFGGGIIPDEDAEKLATMGVRKVFAPGSRGDMITSWLASALDSSATTKERCEPGIVFDQPPAVLPGGSSVP